MKQSLQLRTVVKEHLSQQYENHFYNELTGFLISEHRNSSEADACGSLGPGNDQSHPLPLAFPGA